MTLDIGFHFKQFIKHHRNNWTPYLFTIPITPYPQLSGFLFAWMQYMKEHFLHDRNKRFPNTEANQFATKGLTLSSILFWNYVMHCKYKDYVYKLVCGFDYMMISTTAITSTFPQQIKHKSTTWCVMFLSGLDQLFYYYRYGDIHSYNHHHHVCYVSTFISLYRSYVTKKWMPICIRTYSTLVCTLLFYTSITHLQTIQSYRQVPWYLPWLWHFHAAICQHTSIELAYHNHPRLI